MDAENNFIKPVLLFHFSKGKSQEEAHKEISKQYGRYAITLKTVNKWFEIFSKEYHTSLDNETTDSNQKFKNDYWYNYSGDESGSDIEELEEPSICSKLTISARLSHVSNCKEKVNYYKDPQKGIVILSDKFLIELVNSNPDLNIAELAKLADTSQSLLLRRLKKIGASGEKVNYLKKSSLRGPTKVSDEYIISLVKDNPDLNMRELALLSHTSQGYISRRIKEINCNGERVKYFNKKTTGKPGKPKKFTDEFLINLIDENPGLKMLELAKIANTSAATISNRVRQINGKGEKEHYTAVGTRKSRVKFTDEFLINLVNENPSLNMSGLAKLAGSSQGTISRKLKKINNNGEIVKYTNKAIQKDGFYSSRKPKSKFTDEFLINLVNENPDLNMEQLAKLANTSRATISNRLRKINDKGDDAFYLKKHSRKFLTKFTDEFMINLVNDNPHLNIDELAKIAGTSRSTISKRIRLINTKEEKIHYLKKHSQKSIRKTPSEYLLDFSNRNSTLDVEELSIQTCIFKSATSKRSIHPNIDQENANNSQKSSRKSTQKLTDEFLINLVKENPELNMKELAKLANVSRSTISTMLNKINTVEERAKYIKKDFKKGIKKVSDELLIDLVYKNPNLNMTELAKLAGISRATIAKRLREINNSGEIIYNKKNIRKGVDTFTDEFLINLVNNNPNLNMEELAKLANSSIATISKRIRDINLCNQVINYKSKRTQIVLQSRITSSC
jgi:predicted transcriptional regulator